ncbi:MAG: hypothetical protein PHS37_05025 [Candidatus Omnitrophica bacterium]|nr:hypothetical protein [Candidatus Omnitrophota bacterium]
MLDDRKETPFDNKWTFLILVLVLGIILFSFMARVISNTTYKKAQAYQKPQAGAAPAHAPLSPLYVGAADWNLINTFNIQPVDKSVMKIQLIKVSLEAGIINGNPLITPTVPLYTYLKDIDELYAEPRNASIPLYFAIKIADMKRSGTPAANIEGFKALLLQRLEKAGLVTKQ